MKVFQASILFSAALLALTACTSNTYTITGHVEGLEKGDTLFITNDMQTGIPTDTLIVEDGKFHSNGILHRAWQHHHQAVCYTWSLTRGWYTL